MPPGSCHIGTSGWSYAHWGGGRFYPKGTRPDEWLGFYARHFGTVELNASFYRPPRPETVDHWRKMVPGGFRFAVKLWRRITHDRKLADCSQALRDFLSRVAGFGAKRGPLLIQLPPSLHRDDDRLEAFLRDLKAALGRKRWRLAVEFRHASWLAPPVSERLDRHGAACVLADLARCPIVEPNDVPFVVTVHGFTGSSAGMG